MTTILQVHELSCAFGALRAVDNLSLSVAAGARHAVIGANGAGKSTLFALIDGSQPATSGSILFGGRDITRQPQHRRARAGMARVFQQPTVAARLSTRDNVLLGLYRRAGLSWAVWVPPGRRRAFRTAAETALASVGLADLADRNAGALSHGQRRQLEFAVALSTRPNLLLLDEPAAGLAAAEAEQLTKLVASLPRDITVLLVEHDLDIVATLADTVTVLHHGRHLMTGTPDEVRADSAVRAAYLGDDGDDAGEHPAGDQATGGAPAGGRVNGAAPVARAPRPGGDLGAKVGGTQ